MFKVKESFKWAHRHVEVAEYEAGTEQAFDDADLIEVATAEGWIEPVGERKTKAVKAAPEDKAE